MGALFDPETGEIRGDSGGGDDGCPKCAQHAAVIEQLRADLDLAELALRNERRKVGSLKAELDRHRKTAKERPLAVEVFDYWVVRTGRNPKQVKFGEKREKAVLARLREGYDVADLKLAIDGLVIGAYEPRPGKRYDDLELVMRNEVNVERFRAIGEEHQRVEAARQRGREAEAADGGDVSEIRQTSMLGS